MGSTLKTDFLKLNKWISTDIPKRQDFVDDNEIIDTTIKAHIDDAIVHVTEQDRAAWYSPYFVGFYYGNGGLSRTIETGCPFEPSIGFVFAGGMPPSVTDFTGKIKYNYFGFLSKRTSTSGVTLAGSDIVISTNGGPVANGEYINLNNIGVTYCYVFFR